MTLVVQRAIALLRLFSVARPEIGLSEAARLAGESKATVFRLMSTLCDSGLVELVEARKTYRLGPAVLELSRVREATVPTLSVVQPVLDRLLDATGETCHFSRFNGTSMTVIATAEGRRVNRITMQGIEFLPVCTTAAGRAFLAHAAPETAAAVLDAEPLSAPDRAGLMQALRQIRATGYATVDHFEDENIVGIARPVLRADQSFLGSLAVIVPPNRMTDGVLEHFLAALQTGCAEISRGLGG